MRARHKTGSLIFDKARGTWRFLQWVEGKRESKTIGTKKEYPTKATAWKAVKPITQVSTVTNRWQSANRQHDSRTVQSGENASASKHAQRI
jgi:hypothetical protein